MSQHDIEEIELNISEAKKFVAAGKALDRLFNNRDFKKIIREEYLEKEAVRLVHLKGDPNQQSEDCQQLIMKQIDAISCFTMFLKKIEFLANQAQNAIEAGEEALDELRSGEHEEEYGE